MHVGQAEVAAEVVPGELGVVDAEQVQHRGVQVVDVDLAVDDAVAHVIGFAVGEAAFHAAAGHPGAEAFGLMFAAVFVDRSRAAEVLAPRRAAELAGPEHQRVFEQAALLQVLEQRGDGLIGLLAELGQVAADVAVMIPAVHRDLHEAHAGLAELASQQAGAAVLVAGSCRSDAVEVERGLALVREIDQLRRRGLHAEGEFHVLDHPFHVRVAVEFVDQPLVQVAG